MTEILIRVRDKVSDDFYLNCQCTKRGDVIAVCPDGWGWGTEELSNPDYRIIKTDLAEEEALLFLADEKDIDSSQPSKTLQKRRFKVDLDNAEINNAGLRDFFDTHDVLDVTAKTGTLKDIEVKEDIVSNIEDVKTLDGQVFTDIKTVVNERIIYPVELVSDGLQDKLSLLSIENIGKTLRDNVVVEVSSKLLTNLKVEKAPIEDPNIFGLSPNIF